MRPLRKEAQLSPGGKAAVKEALKVLLKGVPAMMTVVIIIGGIMAGLFTATEAAVVAVIYTFLLGVFYYKELKISHIPGILLEVSLTVGMVVLMVGGTSALGWLFAAWASPANLPRPCCPFRTTAT